MEDLRNFLNGDRFEGFILSTIFVNTILMAMARPNVPQSDAAQNIEQLCTFIFIVECLLKILAFGSREYFGDNWNRLDFIVVCEGVTSAIVSLIPGVQTKGPISTLRLLRLFRPLRALGKFQGTRVVIGTILGSADHTFNILGIILMLLFLCASFAYVYWSKNLQYRCMTVETGIFIEPSNTGHFTEHPEICFGGNPSTTTRYGCGDGKICTRYDHNPQDDTILFDDIWNSFVSAYRIMLRDNWMLTMWYIQDGVHLTMWIPFMFLFFLCTFALVNLFPGAMMTSLQTQVRQVENERKRALDRQGHDDDDDQADTAVRTDFELLLESFEEAYQEDLVHVNNFLGGKEDTGVMKEFVPEDPPYTPDCLPFLTEARVFVEAPFGPFSIFIYVIIFLMVVTLALDGYDQDPKAKKVLAHLNTTYVCIFIAEFAIKLALLGPYGYFGDGFNLVDFVLMVLGVVDLAIESALSGTKSLRVVRIFRLARVARVASMSKVIKLTNPTPNIDLLRIIEILSEASHFILNVFALLIFFNFIFTIAGMQLFGGEPYFDGEKQRFNFDSFNNAFMTTFSITTGSTGYKIFSVIAFNMKSNLVFLFYIVWQILAKYFLLATVAATIFQRVENDALGYMKIMARTTMKSCYLMEKSLMNSWRAIAFRKWRDMTYRAGGRQVTGAFVNIKEDTSMVQSQAEDGFIMSLVHSEGSYALFPPKSGIRIICIAIDRSTTFVFCGFIANMIACAALARLAEVDSGARERTSSEEGEILSLQILSVIFFIFEWFVKSIAHGVIFGKKTYLRKSIFNQIETVATVMAILQLSGVPNLGAVVTIRMVPILLPVKLVSNIKPFRRILTAVIESWGAISNVALITVGIWVLFSLIGMQLFGGFFYSCTDPRFPAGAHKNANVTHGGVHFPNGCSGHYEDTLTGDIVPRKWEAAYLNFDNFFNAMYCSLTIFSLDGWEPIYFSAIDGVDPVTQPVINENKVYAAFFILLILLSFVTIQMIVGSMYGAFMYLNCTAGNHRISSLKVAYWQIYSTKLHYIEPFSDPARPSEGWRLKFYLATKNVKYCGVIMLLTFVNLTFRFFYWGTKGTFYQAPPWVRIMDMIFAFIFFLDWLVRFVAFSWRAVTLTWYDRADTFVTIIGLVYGFLDLIDLQDGVEVWDTLGFELYSVLVGFISMRTIRLLQFFPHTISILYVVKRSTPTLIALAILSAIVTFAYAVVGVSLLGEKSDKFEIGTDASLLTDTLYDSDHANFKRVLPCMQLLYYIGTGADFAGVMQQAQLHTSDDVSWFIPVYLFSYMIIVKYIIFSVCVLDVVYMFTLHATDVNGLAMEAVDDFRAKWQERDPFAEGFIPVKQFPDFIRSLKKPLGIDPLASHLEVDRYIKRALVVMGLNENDIVGDVEELTFDVKFGKVLIALHFLVIFGDWFIDDKKYFQRRVVARFRLRQFKYGVANYIVKIREQAGGNVSESTTGVKDLSVLRTILPFLFEQRLMKTLMHEIYRVRVQIQFLGYTDAADKEVDLIMRAIREEMESAALQHQRLTMELDHVVDKFRLEKKQRRNFRYSSMLRLLLRHITDEREKHLMRTWKLETMQLHSKFRVRDPIVKVAVSDTGEFLFTASSKKIHTWRMKKSSAPANAPLYQLCWGAKQEANVLSLVCTSDAKRFFSGHDDYVIRSWQEDTRGKARKVKHSGKFVLLLQMKGHEGPVYDLKMYEGYILSCGGDATIRFWRARSEETLQLTSLASTMELITVPGFGTGVFCISTFQPILDMNKFTEKDVVTQLLAGTSDGQVCAFVLQTDNAFLFTREWTMSASARVTEESDPNSLLPSFTAAPNVAVTSVVCPNRFGDKWELCFAGTSTGHIKVYEMLWKDPSTGSKQEIIGFKLLWTHHVHASPVSCLTPAGGWLFSGSHDMSVVAWREPVMHTNALAQGHEPGYAMHQGKVTSMAATSEMIYSVDDNGFLLVRNSREKNEVKFIDGEGARQVWNLSETAKARMVKSLKSAIVARSTTSKLIAALTKQPPNEYADLLVPDVWLDTKNPEASFAPGKFLDTVLRDRDDSVTIFTFMGMLVKHYYPKREFDKPISLEVRKWIDTRTKFVAKAAAKSQLILSKGDEAILKTNLAESEQQLLEKKNKEAGKHDPTSLVSVNNEDINEGPLSIDLDGWMVEIPWDGEKTGNWVVAEACRAYFAANNEGMDANQLMPKESMVGLDMEALLKDSTKPGTQLVGMLNGQPAKSYRIGKITLDLPFRKIGAEGSEARRQWIVKFKKEMSESLGGVKPSRIAITTLEPGSVVVTFKIYSEPGNPHAKSPTDLFAELAESVEAGDVNIAGGDVAPGQFLDQTREVATAKEKEDTGIFGFVGEWLTSLTGGGDEDESSSEEESSEEEYSDESEEEDGFEDDEDAVNPMQAAAQDDDDTSSLALSVGERGRKQKKKGKQAPVDVEAQREKDEAARKGNLLDWMGLGGGAAGGGGGGGGRPQSGIVSQNTVASGVSLGDEPYAEDDYDEDEDDYDDEGSDDGYGFEGVEATEMVDLAAMDERMDNLSAWAKAKQQEKKPIAVGSKQVPKDNMKQWVTAKSQQPSKGAESAVSLREWLLFDVALDHQATEEVEHQLREAGFETLAALTSPYAVITDRSLKEMGIRKMGHRAQLLTHLDHLRNKVGVPGRPQPPVPSSSSNFQAEYGLAARLQAMEVDRERERNDRERQLQEISELKDVVLTALQDPEKRAAVQQHAGSGKVGQLLSIFRSEEHKDEDDYDDEEDDNDSVYSGSSAGSSALGGSVGSAAGEVFGSRNQSIVEAARSGKEVTSGVVFGIELGRTQLRAKRDGIEMVESTVITYKHPYFTVQLDNGEVEYLTLGEVEAQMDSDDVAFESNTVAAQAIYEEESESEDEDSGDE
jgi:WD40 repeat protein